MGQPVFEHKSFTISENPSNRKTVPQWPAFLGVKGYDIFAKKFRGIRSRQTRGAITVTAKLSVELIALLVPPDAIEKDHAAEHGVDEIKTFLNNEHVHC